MIGEFTVFSALSGFFGDKYVRGSFLLFLDVLWGHYSKMPEQNDIGWAGF